MNIADALAVAAALGKESLTTTDLQRPRTDDENVRRCAVNLNGRLAYHVRVGKTEFSNVRSYVNDLLRQGREMAGGEASMDLFRDDAPFVERDVMAGIRALLNGSRESAPAGPLGARASVVS